MTPLFIYYLKATIALALFYAFYRLMFDRDTFFGWKRTLLIGSIVLSIVYPFIDITSLLAHNEPVKVAVTYYINTLPAFVVIAPQQNSWWHIPDLTTAVWLIYLAGVIIALIRLLIQLSSILNLRRKGTVTSIQGIRVISLPEKIAPFSFFKWIFINPNQHTPHELNEILAHEQTHVREWHSLDVLFSQLACIAFWFNPFVWLIQHAIRQNLEYLADHRVIHSGYDSKWYQYHLLRLTHHTATANLGNNFNVSELKKRIIMMNKQKSPSLFLTKYVLLIPLVTVLVITNHAEALAKKVEKLAPVNNVIQAVNQLSELKDRPEPLSPTKQKQTQEVILASVEKEAQKTESEKKNIANDNSDDEPFVVVEQMPQYPGGQEAMFKFLAQNIKYPVDAQKRGVQGMVILSFIVSKTGEINTIKIVRGVDPALDNEAIRVVKLMPNWIPGKQKGENVNVKFTLPVRFAFDGGKKEDTPNGGINVVGYGPSKETKPQQLRMAITTNVGKPSLIEINGKEVNESNKPLIIINKKESSYSDFTKIDGRKVKFVGNRESCEKKYLNKLTAKFEDKIDDNTVIVITK